MPHQEAAESGREPAFARAADWLDEKLLPLFGPPALGPYGPESSEPESSRPCPICGHPIVEHRVETDKTSHKRYLHHPDSAYPGVMEID